MHRGCVCEREIFCREYSLEFHYWEWNVLSIQLQHIYIHTHPHTHQHTLTHSLSLQTKTIRPITCRKIDEWNFFCAHHSYRSYIPFSIYAYFISSSTLLQPVFLFVQCHETSFLPKILIFLMIVRIFDRIDFCL